MRREKKCTGKHIDSIGSNPLKMEYKVVDGRNVCNYGDVIIKGLRHRVTNGFVSCNRALNNDAWNVTREVGHCKTCFPNSCKPIQLTLF